MREIVLDTETTGLDPQAGHRIVELACVELENLLPTGRTFHSYFNPERKMPPEAQAVHGLTDEFLEDKPLFYDVGEKILSFVGTSQIVAHNAKFDMGFLNVEMDRANWERLPGDVVDTLTLARKQFPGRRASLDALCDRFKIDRSSRVKHGALLDAELLAEVYLALRGGRQQGIDGLKVDQNVNPEWTNQAHRKPRPHSVTKAELLAHRDFMRQFTKVVWP